MGHQVEGIVERRDTDDQSDGLVDRHPEAMLTRSCPVEPQRAAARPPHLLGAEPDGVRRTRSLGPSLPDGLDPFSSDQLR